MKRVFAAIALALGMLSASYAAIDPRDFANDSQRERYHELAVELRCPKCHNQSIAESDSPIANDLRGQIHRMLREGRSNDQIIDFMVARYGDFVLYDPPLSSRTVLLWLGPAGLLLAGGAIVAVIVASRRRSRHTIASPLSDGEQRRLAGLLGAADSSIGQDI
ncbi:cytochrome c-type biogenesis protein [Paraburkholderia sp. Cpub6]|uniref:cytochrome c-type biogenesis protein n=1 Tax=Paraburkholderia sp. Cpub6 TaxID=2723094 RepID=UPI00160ED484|nr:cytochrome c-type biogenesis protein [Paraburkholderia sp. Cpub6]MBB5460137.1 cytochrome c-type biogenesis protein CcmH [Paraburkholderia sp. Cpub6]